MLTLRPHSLPAAARRWSLGQVTLFALAYFAAAELGRALSYPGSFATFWPPSGLYLAVLAVAELSMWPALLMAALAANVSSDALLHDATLPLSLGYWAANTVEALVGATIVRRVWGRERQRSRLHDLVVPLLIAVLGAPLFGATLGAALGTLAGQPSFVDAWLVWWISDVLGMLLVAPLAIVVLSGRAASFWPPRFETCMEAASALGALAVVTQLAFRFDFLPLLCAIFPLLFWIALRLDFVGLSLGIALASIVAVWNTTHGFGPFAGDWPIAQQIVLLQSSLSVTAVSFLVLLAVINERHDYRRELDEQAAILRELFESLTEMVYTLDAEGRIVFANRAWCQVLGYSAREAKSLSLDDVVHPLDAPLLRAALIRSADDLERQPLEVRLVTRSGRTIVTEGTTTLRQENGRPLATRITRDVTERKSREEQLAGYRRKLEDTNSHLRVLAATDELTGLKNRRTLHERLHEEVLRAERTGRSLSLLLLDVDHFKLYNDTFGHPAGDEVLRKLARILLATARATDVVARYGGEEFALLLPETGVDGAMLVAERIREAVADTQWSQRAVTVSVGVSTWSDATPSWIRLIEEADEALYWSKNNGRNRVCHASEAPTDSACV